MHALSLFALASLHLLPHLSVAHAHLQHMRGDNPISGLTNLLQPRQRQSTQGSATQSAAGTANTGSCTKNGKTYTHYVAYDFTTMSDMEEGEMPPGLVSSENPEGQFKNAPLKHKSVKTLSQVTGQTLTLTLPGGQQNSDPVQFAEVTTEDPAITSGVFITTAQFSSEPGACHGIFVYGESENEGEESEADIEYLTRPASPRNDGYQEGNLPLQLTNHPSEEGVSAFTVDNPAGDATSSYHDYEIDWSNDAVEYKVDGKSVKTISASVPKIPGHFIWNNWSDGNDGWSMAPPTNDALMLIKKIEMWYDGSEDQNRCQGGS